MIFTNWSATGAPLEQKGRNSPVSGHSDWSNSRLERRLEQLEQNGGKLPLARILQTRACAAPLRPFQGLRGLQCVRAREAVAAASVGLLRLGYAPDMTLGRYSNERT
jgi:hypothetical protein